MSDASILVLQEPTAARQAAARSAARGDYAAARRMLSAAAPAAVSESARAVWESDLGTLAALEGDVVAARGHYRRALALDPDCAAARENLAQLGDDPETAPPAERRTRIAILSILFNWPSTGGGTIHTAELGKFLGRDGYDVRHIYAVFPEWGLGTVTEPTGVPSEELRFTPDAWNADEIQRRFREAVDRFVPDAVIITDSWNFKPLLAEAVRGYPYFLRLAALEGLCPLNNVRLLADDAGAICSCPRHQLATPNLCRQCVKEREHQSGSLHQAERALSGYGTPEYDRRLRNAFANAAGVLAVNPLIAAMVSPYSQAVHVVPSGFDPRRFGESEGLEADCRADGDGATSRPVQLFFAGLTEEWMKGFHVLHAACTRLGERRQDFELVATGERPAHLAPAPFIKYIGWQSQSELPRRLREADMLIFPTIAEEALGRSAVEAMAAGKPVIASRIGGLQFTVKEGATGLLFEPGDVEDLIRQIERLLDDPTWRARLGQAGRKEFEAHYTWDVILRNHYRKLFGPSVRRTAVAPQ